MHIRETSACNVTDGVESDSDSDSRDSALKRQQLNSPGKRTIASSSGSDVALHEGAELSPDDNTGKLLHDTEVTWLKLSTLILHSDLFLQRTLHMKRMEII